MGILTDKKSLVLFLAVQMSLLFLSLPQRTRGQMITGLNRDSLKQLLQNMPADSNKVSSLIRLGQQYENNLTDTAVYFYEQARQLSAQIRYPAGFVHYVNNYTAVLNVQGKFAASLKLNLQATDTCRRYGLNELLVKTLINTGVVYQYQDEYEKAAGYYLKSLPLLERQGNIQMLANQYNNLSALYRNLGQSSKALHYARRALAYANKDGDLWLIGAVCNNLGNALQAMDSVDSAIPYIQRAYRIGKQTDDLNMQETALINLGNTYDRPKEPGKYLPVYRAALPLANTLNDVAGKTVALKGIAEGLYWTRQYSAAASSLDTSIPFALQNNQKDMATGLLMLMSDVQIALGQPAVSLQYRQRYDSLQATLVNEGLLKNVQEMETKYEVEKKQHELLQKDLQLAKKNEESLRQRLWLFLAMAGLIILGLSLYLGYRYFRYKQELSHKAIQTMWAEQENIRLKAKLEGQEQERKRISQEMHDDMGSGLTSVLFLSRMIPETEPVALKIQYTSRELVRKMNDIIWSMNPGQDTLDNLIAYIRVNIAEMLENTGIGYDYDITMNIPDIAVGQEFRRHMYLAAKEAVHNVIKHASSTKVKITIRVDRQLLIEIRDYGKGYHPGNNRLFGNGLKNLQHRMEQIDGLFEIFTSDGTTVRLSAPLPI